jgi:hypothetical protein
MSKKMTVSIDRQIYDGIQALIGSDDIGEFLEDLARPFIGADGRAAGYVDDLPPLNSTTFRERIWWCENQRRAFHATRKERTGRADHPQAASVEVEVGRLIPPRLTHHPPDPTATHPFRPRINTSPIRRQTSS